MDIRTLTPTFSVAPQIQPEDMTELAAAGFTTVICNRPDAENPPELQSAAMAAAAQRAGLNFVNNPLGQTPLSSDHIANQRIAEGQKALGYCASGMRSTLLWALSNAKDLETDDILDAARSVGFPLDGMRGQIEQFSRS